MADQGGFAPAIAIIIPAYRQPGLLPEAVASALAQQADFGVAVVIVDDGCPFAETRQVAHAFAAADPRVTVLRKRNGGLSAARNFGIDFALARWPALRAIFFLDADNRLTPNALHGAMAVLEASGADWVYPNIDKFGLEWCGNYGMPYSRLAHLTVDNLCEAGSLVARRVFDAGCRFDETLREGFEDWDFWMQALARGFQGRNHPHFGFEYRSRAESMVRDSNRARDRILHRLRQKHRALFGARALLGFEHAEVPRFGLVVAEGAAPAIHAFTDPDAPWASQDVDAFREAFHAEALEPECHSTPPFLLSLPAPALAALRQARLLHGVLWQAEKLAATHAAVALHLVPDPARIRMDVLAPGDAPGPATGYLLRQASLRDALREAEGLDWLRGGGTAGPGAPTMAHLVVAAPGLDPSSPEGGAEALALLLARLRQDRPARRRWHWRHSGYLPQRRLYHAHLASTLGGGPVMPRLPATPGQPEIGFVLPMAAFGGVERVAHALSRTLRRIGCRTHLFVLGGTTLDRAPEVTGSYDSIALLGEPDFPLAGGPQTFMGHAISAAGDLGRHQATLTGLLAGLDVVVAAHAANLGPLMGPLRQAGTRIINHLHVLDRTPAGREVGHPYLALAFEHAQDLMLTCSAQLAAWLHGMGVPREKLVVVPNAPAGDLPEAARVAHLAARRARPEAPLRVLTLGRLDPQKGVARAVRTLAAARDAGLPVEWRVVGDAVIDPGLAGGTDWVAAFARLGVTVEPALQDDAALAERFAWADVLLLPSRWEGAPLTVLEAQRLGCVPIATDVGAVAEVIDDGVDGLLLPDGTDAAVAAAALAALGRLAADRALLAGLSAAGAARRAGQGWTDAAAPLLDRLEAWFPGALHRPAEAPP